MALQRINWTQIDSANVPSGYTIGSTGYTADIGSWATPIHGVYTKSLAIGEKDNPDILHDFFWYLTGATGTCDITAKDNAGIQIDIIGSGHTLSTTYNTTLDPLLATPATVGGIPLGTTVSELSGKTFVEFVDELLFPVVLPTYTIPTITMYGIASDAVEVGSYLSRNIGVYGIKNDAGSFTQLRILRNGLPILTDISLSTSPEANVPDQFGFPNPNNPNLRYICTPSAEYSEYYRIPEPAGSNVFTFTTYVTNGNYLAGQRKQDNKNITDIRPALVRNANAPQAASNGFSSSSVSITGLYPYFWGVSSTLPTALSIAASIESGSAHNVLASASGIISIPYNTYGNYIWVAYYGNYIEKTVWWVTPLDTSYIDGSFITTAVNQAVNSPDGFWTNKIFKMHWSVYPTIQDTLQFRDE
jgi:hypothetical protein